MSDDIERMLKIAQAIRCADQENSAVGDEYWAFRVARLYTSREGSYSVKLSGVPESQLRELVASPDFNIQVALIIAMERLTDALHKHGRVS